MISNLSRRQFCSSLLALTPLSLPSSASTANTDTWLSAQGKEPGEFSVAWLTQPSHTLVTAPAGFRGHGILQTTPDRALMIARKPGQWLLEVDLHSSRIIRRQQCPQALFFEGHACTDGKHLYTTESDQQTGAGRVGIYDLATLQRLGEHNTYGIGPHEIKLMPDGETLVVANGGLRSLPGQGWLPVNVSTMQSSLSYLDKTSGRVQEQHRIKEPKASLRHLDVAADGTVAFGLQVQRAAMDHSRPVALTGLHRRGQTPQLLAAPETLWLKLHDYIGSVTINPRSRTAGFTSPKGNVAIFWHLDSQQLLGWHSLHDVCGIAVNRDHSRFVLTSGAGQLRQLDAFSLKEIPEARLNLPGVHWDNHLTHIDLPG